MRGDPTTPCGWANTLVRMWGPRFPVNVRQIALEYSTRFTDPVRAIVAADVPSFEGALYPHPKGGWAILYNPSISSPGRINFTLGHEWGHYLCHRLLRPDGIECGVRDVVGGSRNIEQEADRFASYLLMPMDDFRAQVGGQAMTGDLLRHCADRYEVSLTAAALKWLEATDKCAAVVVATNGFVCWFKRSAAAEKARLFWQPGTELPSQSVAASSDLSGGSTGVSLPAGVWADRAVREVAIFADKYEMTVSLLVFEEREFIPSGWDAEDDGDVLDRFRSR